MYELENPLLLEKSLLFDAAGGALGAWRGGGAPPHAARGAGAGELSGKTVQEELEVVAGAAAAGGGMPQEEEDEGGAGWENRLFGQAESEAAEGAAGGAVTLISADSQGSRSAIYSRVKRMTVNAGKSLY